MPAHLEPTLAWNQIADRLRQAVGDSVYEVWLSDVTATAWDGTLLLLSARSGAESWLAGRYGHVIESCARAVLGASARVAFAGDPAARAHAAMTSATRVPSDGLIGAFNPRHTFDQFVIGDGNRLAHGAALAVAEAPGDAYNPLFLHASPGLGKTHLLNAIGNYITAFDPTRTVRYTTVEAFTNGFIAALRGEALDHFKRLHRDLDVLLIDDVQFLASKAKTEEEFFHTFNALYDSGRQLVITCDRLPSQLIGIEQRLRERFESGLVAHVAAPDMSTRVTILRKRAALDRIPVADERVFELIAERVRDNIRSLEGALIRVVAHHSLTGHPIDVSLTTHVLDEIHPLERDPDGRTAEVSIPAIQQTVARHFGMAVSELTGPGRQGAIPWARQLAMYLSREMTQASLQTIGEAFGGRNHATVVHAHKRVAERIAVNNQAAAELEALFKELSRQQ